MDLYESNGALNSLNATLDKLISKNTFYINTKKTINTSPAPGANVPKKPSLVKTSTPFSKTPQKPSIVKDPSTDLNKKRSQLNPKSTSPLSSSSSPRLTPTLKLNTDFKIIKQKSVDNQTDLGLKFKIYKNVSNEKRAPEINQKSTENYLSNVSRLDKNDNVKTKRKGKA